MMKNLIKIICLILFANSSKAMVNPGTPLRNFNYSGASVLPLTSWGAGPRYALLSEEAHGRDQGTFDDFGGQRDPGETHPVVTAAREAWEESVNLLGTSEKNVRDYIDLKAGHTEDLVISIDKPMPTYITNFSSTDLENLTKKFYSALKKATNRKLKEKSRLAWINYDELKKTIAAAPRNPQGALITPITITANIVNPANPRRSGQIKTQINLRPVFVSKLQEYFKGSPYIQGTDPKIKFFKRGYKPAHVIPPAKPTIPPSPVIPSKPHIPEQSFAHYPYKKASVLPFAAWPSNWNNFYFLLSQDAHAEYPNTWSDFNGIKLSDENNPYKTAERVSLTQSLNLLTVPSSDTTILKALNNVENIVISEDQQMVTFITKFPALFLENVARHFYSRLSHITDPASTGKKAIAWVKYDDLQNAIENAQLNAKGELMAVMTQAITIKSTDIFTPREEPSGKYSPIILNPLFVSKLYGFFKNAAYKQGERPNIKFFKNNPPPAPLPLVTPIIKKSVNSIESLSALSMTLNALSLKK